MASAKGIAITAAIIVGVVGASMLVWFSPQGELNEASFGEDVTAGNIDSFLPEYALGLIYNRHQIIADDVDFDYDRWKGDDIDSSRMLRTISDAKDDTTEMREVFDAATPPEEWQQSFDLYAGALDSFSSYLDEMEEIVRSGERSPNEATLEAYKQNSEDQVELATQAMPIDPLNTN